jgi:hypothetical protein
MISFVQGEDKIDLSRIDANQTNNVPPPATNDAFEFIGTAAFSAPGQVRYTLAAGGTVLVEANVDAALGADLILHINSQITPTAADFIL